MKQLSKRIAALLLVVLIFSCKKKTETSPGDKSPDQPQAVPAKHGDLVGAAITKTIGAAGGTLQAFGDSIKIDIPAGAIDHDVQFSVQQVTNTIGSLGLGKVYRLLPENVTFSKDIQVTLSYSDEDINGTSKAMLALAYQDKDGYWHRARNSVVDSANHALTVATKHFSDWTAHTKLIILNKGKSRLKPGETTTLEVKTQFFSDDMGDLLAPEIEVKNEHITGWQVVAGPGEVTGAGKSATFKAPARVTEPTVAKVMATAENVEGSKLNFAFTDIEIVPEAYIVWYVDGFKRFATSSITVVVDGQQFYMATRDIVKDQGSFYMKGTGLHVGTYSFGPSSVPGNISIEPAYENGSEGGYIYISGKYCENVLLQMPGSVTITSVTGYITGEFSGKVIQQDFGLPGCFRRTATVRGSFCCKMP
jgi:hypothetical protein